MRRSGIRRLRLWGAPDGGPKVRDVVPGADHDERVGEADDAEVVRGDGVLE
jgi:hypothetical protein